MKILVLSALCATNFLAHGMKTPSESAVLIKDDLTRQAGDFTVLPDEVNGSIFESLFNSEHPRKVLYGCVVDNFSFKCYLTLVMRCNGVTLFL